MPAQRVLLKMKGGQGTPYKPIYPVPKPLPCMLPFILYCLSAPILIPFQSPFVPLIPSDEAVLD